ncbi:hypothetical protein L1887_15048 [Cichorium endivia]|nr:hypothetical protein L1887_15048 [Cichorium endivia]
MNQSWLLIEPNKHRKICDVCNHVLHIFNLRDSCPNGILLYMDGFVLPPSESTRILKDKEILCVRRKGMALTEAIEGADAGNLVDYLEVNRKEPVNNGMLLLANEEFDKETGGYQSESEEEMLEDESSPVETLSKKRKSSIKLRTSKKKKHRSMMDDVEDEVAIKDNNINNDKCCPMKTISNKIKPNKEKESVETIIVKSKSPLKAKRKKKHHLVVVSGVEGEVVRDEICKISKKKIEEDDEISDKRIKSPLSEKRSETSTSPDEGKKGPSRSSRRKKAKRQWKKELAKISQKPDAHLEPEVFKEANGHLKEPVKQNHVKKNIIEEEKKDTELVACVVKPGHIRFEPLDEDEEAKQIEVQDVGFEWNGIRSKKKGQKWGIEKYSTSQKDDSQKARKEVSSMVNVDLNDFENLPLCTSPKEGDVIAYRLVELSSSWTPELSSYRVGKISHYDGNNIVLKPVAEYPIVLDKMDEDGPDNNSLYKEDGTLEIKFAGLVDVRSVKQSNSEAVKAVSNGVGQSQSQSQSQSCRDDGSDLMPSSNGKKENISKDPSPEATKEWDEVMEALNAKKSELLEANQDKESGWNRWSYRALRGSALGPTMALLRSNNNI